MVLAYVLIATGPSNAERVAKELTNIVDVDSVHVVDGAYDIVVRVKAKDVITFREEILAKMQKVQGVENVMSLLAADMTRASDNPVTPMKNRRRKV